MLTNNPIVEWPKKENDAPRPLRIRTVLLILLTLITGLPVYAFMSLASVWLINSMAFEILSLSFLVFIALAMIASFKTLGFLRESKFAFYLYISSQLLLAFIAVILNANYALSARESAGVLAFFAALSILAAWLCFRNVQDVLRIRREQ